MHDRAEWAAWLAQDPPPNLQAMVERFGGYWDIPEEAWRTFQEDVRAWQERRRDRVR